MDGVLWWEGALIGVMWSVVLIGIVSSVTKAQLKDQLADLPADMKKVRQDLEDVDRRSRESMEIIETLDMRYTATPGGKMYWGQKAILNRLGLDEGGYPLCEHVPRTYQCPECNEKED